MSRSIATPARWSFLWSAEPGSGVRMKNSRRSIGSSRWMMRMSRSIEAGVSPGKAEDVAGVCERADAVPRLQHRAVLGDVVLAFPRLLQRIGVDALQADEHAVDPGARRLLDEAADLVASVSTWATIVNAQALLFAHLDQPVEDRLPVLVAREVVVGDEEVVHALREVGAHEALDVVGVARARLASLDVDDRAEAAVERAAAAGVEARPRTAGAATRRRPAGTASARPPGREGRS